MIRALALLAIGSAAIAADAPHLTAGPGTPPSVTVLAAEVRAVVLERDALRAENAMLKTRIAGLEAMVENLVRIQQRDTGLRTPTKSP